MYFVVYFIRLHVSRKLVVNQRVALRTRGQRKKIHVFANFHANFQVICPFRLHKICQCCINQENLSHMLELILKTKRKCFYTINSILYRYTGVNIDKEGRCALRSAEVYMCLEQNVVFIRQIPPKTYIYIQNSLKSSLLRCILHLVDNQ